MSSSSLVIVEEEDEDAEEETKQEEDLLKGARLSGLSCTAPSHPPANIGARLGNFTRKFR